ncbi:VanZ family protein [Mycetocola sp. 2940]|uniref:VanZ family protein n=1 Tax=Mycetocola sp. 2940 TaxID=3156452 RepID=UPI00339B88EE
MPARASRTVALSFVGILVVGVGMVLLWPTPVDRVLHSSLNPLLDGLRAAGFPSIFRYGVLEFAANAALFLALGFVLALFMPQGRRWMAPTLCVAGSFAAEFTQLVFRPGRQADPTDVLANSIGGLVGTVLVIAMLRRRERQSHGRHTAR